MTIKSTSLDGATLKCVLLENPSAYDVDPTNPDTLFPTVCFDNDMHLRAVSASATVVKFDDVQPFQNRSVARDVKVLVKGAQVAEMKVSLQGHRLGAVSDRTGNASTGICP